MIVDRSRPVDVMEIEGLGGRKQSKDKWSAALVRTGEEYELPNGCSYFPSRQTSISWTTAGEGFEPKEHELNHAGMIGTE
jgi:hypothetical protein